MVVLSGSVEWWCGVVWWCGGVWCGGVMVW